MNFSTATTLRALLVATFMRWRTLRSTSIVRQSDLAKSISASTRRICFASASFLQRTIEGRTAALRFLFVKTLHRPYLPDHIPFPKRQRRLPTILDQQEVARLIDSAGNLMHRTMLMMLYASGLRRAEMCHLKVSDIDSKRMVINCARARAAVTATCS